VISDSAFCALNSTPPKKTHNGATTTILSEYLHNSTMYFFCNSIKLEIETSTA
jgi:hypothetical protein